MLKKRLIGVVTVKNGWAVQSFGYSRYLPLGKPEWLVENLDRWGADEILVQITDRSSSGAGPDFALLEQLGTLGLATPLIYAGGVRTVSDGVNLIQSGADRIVVDSLLHDDVSSVRGLSERLGAQAVIASMPLSWCSNYLEWYDYRFKSSALIKEEILNLIRTEIISEVLISDWKHDGIPKGFDQRLVNEFPLNDAPIIAFGGISACEQMCDLFQLQNVSALAIGNFLAYREHAVQKYKEAIAGMPVRSSTYEIKNPL